MTQLIMLQFKFIRWTDTASKKLTIKLFSMSLDLPNIIAVIEVMENYIARERPPEHMRGKLDIAYTIENQSVIIQEIRPVYQDPERKIESGYAKATYIKSSKKWKVYWMRSNLKWCIYEPKPEVDSIKEFVDLVNEDSHHCFKG